MKPTLGFPDGGCRGLKNKVQLHRFRECQQYGFGQGGKKDGRGFRVDSLGGCCASIFFGPWEKKVTFLSSSDNFPEKPTEEKQEK